MLIEEIINEDGLKISVFDEAVSMMWHSDAYDFCKKAKYALGWEDTPDISGSKHVYMHSMMSDDDIDKYDAFSGITCPDLKKLVDGKTVSESAINLTFPTDTYFPHVHAGMTMLIYNNLNWSPHWAGETLFYSNDLRKVIYAAIPAPRRVLVFDGVIPHSLRPHSIEAPHHRFTTAVMFDQS